MPRRLPIIATVVAIAALALLAARPLRWEVDGLSMAPALLPGDVVASGVFPALDRLRPRQRFERWIVRAPDGSDTIKRLVGLPGERIGIVAGDLVVDGARLLTPPDVLAQIATPVAAVEERSLAGLIRLLVEGPILDDAAFAPEERRLLLPVRDVGIAAIVTLKGRSATAARVILSVDTRAVRFTPTASGQFALVVGRLDGRFVATAWPLAPGANGGVSRRDALPGGAPHEWSVARPWPDCDAAPEDPPVLECRLETDGTEAALTIDRLSVWRDVLQRPAADGVSEWRLRPDALFVLGDFPSGSRDSRHWGPITAAHVVQRVVNFPTR
ncbi:MAG: S26 family signal peptidase [Planctomycetota bacterium]